LLINCLHEFCYEIAGNGKSIGEGRATLTTISKENRTWAKCFFRFLKLLKKEIWKAFLRILLT